MYSLLDRLEKTANEVGITPEYLNQRNQELEQQYAESDAKINAYRELGNEVPYTVAGGLLGTVGAGGSAMYAMRGSGGGLGAKAVKGATALGAGVLGGLAGSGAATMGADAVMNARNPERRVLQQEADAAYDTAWDDTMKYVDEKKMYKQQNRGGARSVSDEPAGIVQTANEDILDRLEKTANEHFDAGDGALYGALGGTIGGATVGGVIGNKMQKKVNNLFTDPDVINVLDDVNLPNMRQGTRVLRNGAIGLGGAGGALLGLGAGATIGAGNSLIQHMRNNGANPEEIEQTANEEILDRLEKTAANLVKPVKNFFGNLSGSNLRNAKSTLGQREARLTKAQGQLDKSVTNGQFDKQPKLQEKVNTRQQRVDDSKKQVADVTKATRSTQIGTGAGLAAGAAGASLATKKKDEEKTASENFMTGLYKEAASEIMETTFPSVKEIVDPINQIRFDR